jgi:hypothetical protein
MGNLVDAQLALRARLLTLEVCGTGTTSLGTTANTYTRSSGSFVSDGFAVGMEVTPTGFTDTDPAIITAVAALSLTVDAELTIDAEAPGRNLMVGLPELRAWDNTALEPEGGRPYIEEQMIPGGASLLSFPSSGGEKEDTGLYVIRWYGKANTGLSAIGKPADALLSLFAPGTVLTVGTDVALRIRTDVAPYRGQMQADLPGWSVVTVTIPWKLSSIN